MIIITVYALFQALLEGFARSKSAVSQQPADVGSCHDLSLSAEEAARLQGFVDGSEVCLMYNTI